MSTRMNNWFIVLITTLLFMVSMWTPDALFASVLLETAHRVVYRTSPPWSKRKSSDSPQENSMSVFRKPSSFRLIGNKVK